jgi:hypothetical protein
MASVDVVGGDGGRVSDELLVCLVDSSVVDVKGGRGMTRTRERESEREKIGIEHN